MEEHTQIKRRRDRLEIIAEILEAARNGKVKTRIMYETNLNYDQFKDYISNLMEARLVMRVKNGKRTIYRATDKGLLLLRKLEEKEMLLNEINYPKVAETAIIKKGSNYFVKR